MEKVFLSYTYRPHPAHEASLERLHKYVVRALEAMDLLVVDGVDVGGRALDEALRQQIKDSDALIALVTPQSDDAGGLVEPQFVLSEFQHAEGGGKPTIRVLHQELAAQGLGVAARTLGVGNEYAPYTPGKEVDVILKLISTIKAWRRLYGQAARVRIEPEDLTKGYDENQGDRCHVQVISQTTGYPEYKRAPLWLEPGAAYALLPKVRKGEQVRLRLSRGGKTWESPIPIDPFIGAVRLEVPQ
jgi:hypothetical protein